MRPVEEALLLCARAERTDRERECLQQILRAADDGVIWQQLWTCAARQEIVPLVAHAVSAAPLAGVLSAKAVKAAKAMRLRTMMYNMAVHAELRRIGVQLRAHGIPATPLKGSHLAERLYGALDARQVGDIDIFVPGTQLAAARQALREMGYQQSVPTSPGIEEHSFHGAPLVREDASGGFMVELHWQLNNPRFVSIDYQRLWRRILNNSDASASLRPLPSEELLVFLSLHLAKHENGVLRLLADVDRLVRREGSAIDWAYTVGLAERWSVSALVYFALLRAQTLLGTPVPSKVLVQLRPASWRCAVVDLLAGPRAVMRPLPDPHLQYNRFRMAYCAMLVPAHRAALAYSHYVFPDLGGSTGGLLGAPAARVRRVARGLAWTGLVLAKAVSERWRTCSHEPASALRPQTLVAH